MERKLTEITLPCPAKINRFLKIIGRREDGYHLLQTVFQFLNYGDEIRLQARQDDQIILFPAPLMGIPTEHNLIYRAACALQQAAGIHQGVSLEITKNIPLGAGLGGGSSNAATTLIGLNALWQLHWPLEDLLRLGLTLGADVPVFIQGQAAFAQGIGEILTPIEIDEPWILLLLPDCQVSTPKMYSDEDLTRDSQPLRMEALSNGEIGRLLSELGNDFEPLVRRHYAAVDEAMIWLSNYSAAMLSGSGASVFACFQTQEQANLVAQKVPGHMKGIVTKGTNVSSLKQAMKRVCLDLK